MHGLCPTFFQYEYVLQAYHEVTDGGRTGYTCIVHGRTGNQLNSTPKGYFNERLDKQGTYQIYTKYILSSRMHHQVLI